MLYVIELHGMSLAMASHLNGQENVLSDIDKNVTEANEKALLLTIHTAKMTQRTRGSKISLTFTYLFLNERNHILS